MTPAIKLDGLGIGYNGNTLFPSFSLEVWPGTMNVIIGANGSGKSTLLYTIAGTLRPVEGRVFVEGTDTRGLSSRRLARLLSLTYTERLVSGGLTVRELVQMGRHPYTGLLGHLSREDKNIVESAMHDVGIAHKAANFLSDISDGERQKAMIARALAQQTPVMLFDEPTNYLDAASRLEVLGLIRRLVDRKGITAVLSGHDTSSMLALADNVITVLPSGNPAVRINGVDTDDAARLLDNVFADRRIRYDASSRDYRLT